MNIKIFSIYYKPATIFQSEMIVPIHAGASIATEHLDIMKDNAGENISHKNRNYGELTAWYYVWKNYLVENPDIEYVGFCHYRRFFDFSKKPLFKPFHRKEEGTFKKEFANNAQKEINLSSYDVVLPKLHTKGKKNTLEGDYLSKHPSKDLLILKAILREKYPHYAECMESVLARRKAYHCLTFVMRKELFMELAQFAFDILFELEKQSDWTNYTGYNEVRTPAFLFEHFFNIWLEYKTQHDNIKIWHRRAYLLVQDRSLKQKIMQKLQYAVPIKHYRKKIREKYDL